MKLIDADALKYHKVFKEDWLGNKGKYSNAIFEDEVEAQPTVDAVPTEWIDKYTYENPLTCYEGFHAYIRNMICEWRKENES